MSALVCTACGESPLAASPGCTSPHEVASVETTLAVSPKLVMPTVKPKAKAPARWRGQSYAYLNKEGVKYMVFHRSASGTMCWEHAPDDREGCVACV